MTNSQHTHLHNRGKKISEECKMKIGLAKKDKTTKDLGRKFSEERRSKRSEVLTGRKKSVDRTGTKFSEGYKRKTGLASARMWSIRKSKQVSA